MSRGRLPRAENDLYSRHPLRIVRAFEAGELDFYAYAVLSYLVDKIEAPGSNGEHIFRLEALSETLAWPLGGQSLRDKLHELRRHRWIDFDDPRRGPGAVWIVRLSGAAIDGERAEFPRSFQPETPLQLETNSNRRRDVEAANPLPDGVSDLPEFPTGDLPGAEQSEAQTLTEENYDHLVGKTTAAALDETAGEGANFLHAVGQAAAEALESEREFLADRQALVDAGEAWWVKNDDDDRSERQ